MAKKKPTAGTPIDSTKHRDTRKNIPTEELRDFVAEQEQKPTTVLYPRDPSLDPQLVWKGKDEQDSKELEVPAVPIYIQEKIHPQAIIEDFRRTAEKVETDQPDLFGDFNGLNDFDKKVDFYHHDQHWSNRMILGDSLLVMTSLAEKEGLKGKVQTIYFDPPYGIKFGSNWQVSTRKRDVKDGKAEDATRQPEQIRAFRDTWKLGIHSYLAYLRDRLVVARELLTESGSVFVQISEHNVHHVRELLDEVFGASNFFADLLFFKAGSLEDISMPRRNDYILWYAKDAERIKFRRLFVEKSFYEETSTYNQVCQTDGKIRSISEDERRVGKALDGGKVFRYVILTKPGPGQKYEVKFQGRSFLPGNRWWGFTPESMDQILKSGRIVARGSSLESIRYLDDFPVTQLDNVWTDTASGSGMDKIYVVQTNAKVIQRCLLMTTDPGDLVLDPTCGSGTTAYVAEQWGRRWITTDTSRVAIALARTRLMTGRFPYYLLSDSPQGVKKEAELTGKTPPPYKTEDDIRKGFVYQRVPHVTLKSIANNPDIKEGLTRKQIDDAIARHAESETLYDKPYEDKSRLRVTGPFTVESLSPHRTISVEDKKALSEKGKEGWKVKLVGPSDFSRTILENLKKAGVQNTVKNERLNFDSLEPYAGEWIQGEGRYTDGDGKEKRAAICIGPEHGTVAPQLVKEAAKEAVRGVGFDILIICGFAFDPHVSEEAKRYGKLTVLSARMNPDLAMGDELLKKTGAGNLFMVFGEPDLKVETEKDGKIVVEIKGLDVYDPTTGEIRSNTTDDIACWFIDTNYNGESFFVRHAYFTGADEPYEKLKNALRAEIDESAWSALYATRSRPFEKPETGKIAVKVINHYGDEVLKVYPVGAVK
ncbi:MAG: site-specific DNA-methyltransferase [Tepidisphaeraceae bacterium]|jgi:adenine-specific DNA-methyltransferase